MSNKFKIYEVEQRLIDFLRGDGEFADRPSKEVDKQVYSHYGLNRKNSDKYFGVIIEYKGFSMFAPITHDGDKKWFNRDNTYDVEKVYDGFGKYSGVLLLCKALPLDKVLTKNVNFRKLIKTNYQYARLCIDELNYLNKPEIHQKVVKKMMACLENKPSKCQHLRVNYQLCAHNLLPYFKLIKSEKAKELEKENTIEQEEELVR